MSEDQAYFKISVPSLTKTSAFLPSFGALFCILYSVIFDFEHSTATHCKVPNFLPTISAAIGEKPQIYVWRICICLHSTPRILMALSYYRFHTNVHVGKHQQLYTILAASCSFLHICENFALIVLTYVSSSENYGIHEKAFILFMVFSMVYMCLTCMLFGWGRTANGRHMTVTERRSYHYKISLFVMNVSCAMLAVYLFLRHNTYCEPGVYSQFAFCEYLVVFTNILYHLTQCLDYNRTWLVLGK
ncbi:post-GPI attachment to proteins factor 2-like isoform X2 [Gigantopelta aegis]|uniref:post-GPI attachment to proteins factor 2-like isoform X2 n=1 Tax=Gigantopelta aegis TaxID=1735272 RepID=UPI001B88A7F9|nr:post-GPI attachment to proteins factor 2-like isoform X2 [Gigantopelta aegis]